MELPAKAVGCSVAADSNPSPSVVRLRVRALRRSPTPAPPPTPWLLPGAYRHLFVAASARRTLLSARWSLVVIFAGIGFLPRHQAVLGVDDLALAIYAKAFRDAAAFARFPIDGFARELALGLGRRGSKRRPRSDMRPYRLHHRLEDRHRNPAACCPPAECAPLAIGIVVAEPYRDSDVVAKSDEPGIVVVVGSAGLARDVRRQVGNGASCAARENALHHAFELIERRMVYGNNREGLRLMPIDDL